jgi:hypothetical protein
MTSRAAMTHADTQVVYPCGGGGVAYTMSPVALSMHNDPINE